MIAVWVLVAVFAFVYAVGRLTAAPAARGVPVSVRFADAERIVEDPAGRRPCEHPLEWPSGQARRHQPPNYIAHCNSGGALGPRHPRRP